MLSCRDCLARHSDYLDGNMDVAAAEAVRVHLMACADCARYDRVLRRGVAVLRAQPALTLPEDFAGELQQRLAAEDRRALRLVSALPAAAFGVAAMLAFLVITPLFMMRSSNHNTMAAAIVPASVVATEIAWHGESAVEVAPRAHVHLTGRRLAWSPSSAGHPIEPTYTPIILESPIAPPSYSD